MFEASSVLYFFVAAYAAGLMLPYLTPERVQFTGATSAYRPLTLCLIIILGIAAYLSDLHFVFEVVASTALILLPLSVRQELMDEKKKIFGPNPLSKILWRGLIFLCLVFFGRVLLGPSSVYASLIFVSIIATQILLILELIKSFRSSNSIHLFCAILAALAPVALVITRIVSISAQAEYEYKLSLHDDSGLPVLIWLIIAASCFILLNAVTNFQFQKLWNKERDLRLDTERASLDSLLALSQARASETGKRIIRKKKYVAVLIDNLRPKGWITMPDLDAQMEQLFADDASKYDQKYAVDGRNELLDSPDQDASMPGNNIPQTVRLMALADVYEVLTSKQLWKRSWRHKEAIDEITKMAGNRLDPTVVNAFLEEQIAFSAIADVWRDD
jgi:hypothetical protein